MGVLHVERQGVLAKPTSFNPAAMGTLVGWYKADSLSQSDASAVTSWPDSSGVSGAAVQGTAGLQPTFRTSVLNSLPVVRFDGSDALVIPAVIGNTAAAPLSLFVVAKLSSGTNGVTVSTRFSAGGWILRTDSSTLLRFAHISGGAITLTSTYGTFRILTATRDGTNAGTIGVDGSSTAGTPGIVVPSSGTVTHIGGSDVSGTGIANGNFFTGDIAEVLIYSTYIGATNTDLVEAYLGAKYAITVA